MNQQINQVVKAMTSMMVVGMTFGMASPIMLQSRKNEPKSEAERRATHKAKYGDERLPPKGSGLSTQRGPWIITYKQDYMSGHDLEHQARNLEEALRLFADTARKHKDHLEAESEAEVCMHYLG